VAGFLLEQTPTWLAQAPAPFLLAPGPWRPLRRLLVVLRGFASDARLLDWVVPLARQSRAAVTLLVLSHLPCPNLQALFCREGPHKAHIDSCRRRLEEEGTSARLVIRQGLPLNQLLDELAQPHGYDLLALAAEGQGVFVTQVLMALQRRRLHAQRPVLIVKPPV
ncbi:MAG TPA: universal stress protein, partial [Caldilineaceae bacterium]|nr:universal stress protein [Caldilineaceae bacterium]